MQIEVIPYPGVQPTREQVERTIVVMDVLRATSTIVTALDNGATEVIPLSDASEAIVMARRLGEDQCLTGGERGGLPIPGLNLGNSPREYTHEVISGKKLALCTTNGTQAIRWAQPGKKVFIASFLNLPALVAQLLADDGDLLLVCSGRNGGLALEDVYCAGMIVHQLATEITPSKLFQSDSAVLSRIAYQSIKRSGLEKGLFGTDHGKALKELGMDDDVSYCAQVGVIDKVPIYTGGKIILP